jgi:hypothetical protein
MRPDRSKMVKLLWPDVEIDKGRTLAVSYGAIAMGIQALALSILGVIELFPGTGSDSKVEAIESRVIGATSYLIVALVFVVLCRKTWHKHSLVAAGLGLLLATAEVVLNLRQTYTVDAVESYALLLLSVHGVRGVQAMRRAAVNQSEKELSNRLQSARNAIASLR